MMKVKFTDVFEDVTKYGTKISTDKYIESGCYPIVDQGKSQIAGYIDNREGLYENIPAIIFGDHTRVVKYIDFPCFLGADGVKLLKPKDDRFDCKYLYYVLSNARIPNTGYNRHYKWLKEVSIPIKSVEEQERIVSVLDKISELISLRRQQIEKLDELVKARFVELFGDSVTNPKGYLVKPLQELIDMGYITYHLDGNHGGDYPRSEEFVDSGVPYIGANSIVNSEIDFSMAKYLTEERAGKLRKGIAKNEDVLFAHNATVGPTVVLKTTEPKVILSTSLTAYRCNKANLLPNYLKAYMQSDGFVRQYSGEMKQTTRNQVPITAQKKYLFIVPPIAEQEQFAAFVKQTDKSKLTIQQSLDKLEVLKKSLMQKYFG